MGSPHRVRAAGGALDPHQIAGTKILDPSGVEGQHFFMRDGEGGEPFCRLLIWLNVLVCIIGADARYTGLSAKSVGLTYRQGEYKLCQVP